MALFTITRYSSDDFHEDVNIRKNEEHILEKLNKQIKGKSHTSDINKSDERRKKRKHAGKSTKSISETQEYKTSQDSAVSLSVDEDLLTPSKSKKKKSKQDKKLATTSPDCVEDDKSHTNYKDKDEKECKISEENEIDDETSDGYKINKSDINQKDDLTEKEPKPTNEANVEMEDEEKFTVIGQVMESIPQRVQRVLPAWLSQPSVVKADILHNTTPLSDLPGIDTILLNRLQANGIHSFFPVQAQVIPALLEGVSAGFLTGRAGYIPSDICCSAPTGSGKTLAYVLPIIQALKHRVTCQVRALVVLPVQDLAFQVYKVFQSYCKATPLKVACIGGNMSLAQEKSSLVTKCANGFQCNVDIIVATPGRLVDHIHNTCGFKMTQLRYLVIDEADRMIEEIKQDWLAFVDTAVYKDGRDKPGPLNAASVQNANIPLQKLLFSATLSQNPEKLQQLGLFQPRLFTSVVHSVQKITDVTHSPECDDEQLDTEVLHNNTSTGDFVGKYTTPEGLTEYFYETSAAEKPLAMLYFLRKLQYRQILCFTNSVETTHRLYLLMKLVGGVKVSEFSSRLHSKQRTHLLKQFEKREIDMLICSDAMARGMDVDNVKYVISYESPPYLKTYIHRVGRTARAGKQGTAISLLENKEIYHFKKMMTEAGKNGVEELKFKTFAFKPYVKPLKLALTKLPDELKLEKQSTRK